MLEFAHIPVLYREIMEIMAPKAGETFVDCTLGGGGHSKGFLERTSPNGRLIGIDQDLEALEAAKENLAQFGERVSYIHSNYENLSEILVKEAPEGVDGILFDIGVSSHQLDDAERGFSYMHDAPLDMRMDQTKDFSAYEVANRYSEDELYRIIRDYGEENWAKRIAQFIVEKRKIKAIETTGELVDIIKAAIPKKARMDGSHPAKRTFQAIRIEVNGELEVLEKTIEQAVKNLKKGGRLGIISFHSLEDRIVKEKFKYLAAKCICPPEMPICCCNKVAEVKILTKKPITAQNDELMSNSRAKSAKFRAVEKIV